MSIRFILGNGQVPGFGAITPTPDIQWEQHPDGVPLEVVRDALNFEWVRTGSAAKPGFNVYDPRVNRPVFIPDSRAGLAMLPGVLHPDHPGAIGHFGGRDSYGIHQPSWLVEAAEAAITAGLRVNSVYLINDGLTAGIQLGTAEGHEVGGYGFRPFVGMSTGVTGKTPTFGGAQFTASVCENTVAMGMAQALSQADTMRVRHTRYSVDKLPALVETVEYLSGAAAIMAQRVEQLLNTVVTADQWEGFLTAYAGDVTELEGRSRAFAETRIAKLRNRYEADREADTGLMGGSQWQGTALGVVQAANTVAHWDDIRRGGDEGRWEANLTTTLAGDWSAQDDMALEALLSSGVLVPVLATRAE